MNYQISITGLWRETFAAATTGMRLYLPIAAAFVLLPGVAIELFGPALPKTPAELTPNLVFSALVLPSLIAIVAQAAIVRLAIDKASGIDRSVGEALLVALRLWPLLVVALLLAAVPIGAGLLLFIVPGLYMAGRLTLAMPLVIDGVVAPIAAVRRSWELTEGNGWRIIAFTIMWAAWFLALSAIAAIIGGGVATALNGLGAGAAGAVISSVIGGVVGALFTVFNAVGIALIYLRLRR
ncbi:glycerophosphoryl diester phosphodiesterase membrane domain-containing protein [Polymorphobacter sp. PAMC 29334]|uniref:glycerophosphoryl diester phosphodiesterase membrane domain-containing protein n=1 Tax=Polymorphobacter sp. PAMC 29334 TaxID=2862331 RepID=UPI001C74E7CD|nr:glycerophosphoryl diester phosphodiesterase membrane domain-containing protein [Polymorphobacter sp. PAMC 29334]QYE35001.1 glycerophosphoryl diester phosphodiesterase membrane domain-containing protein [Polymorphobacter sp. PAMC 29334]